MIDYERTGSMTDNNPVFEILNQFYEEAFTNRDIGKAALLLSEDIYYLGTVETVFGRDGVKQLFAGETRYVLQPIRYRISDYRQKACGENSWNCFFKLEIASQKKEACQDARIARVTACIVREDEEYRISVMNSTMVKGFVQRETRFPFRIILNGTDELDQVSRREILDMICETLPSGVIGGYLEDGYPIYMVNDKLLELLGFTYQEFIQETDGNVLNRIWEEDRGEILSVVEKECEESGEYEVEYRMIKKDGSFLWVYDRGRTIITQDGRKAVISLIVDISENVKIKNHLFAESVTDPLTGLYNRRGGEVMITQKLTSGKQYIFLMMDIDNFKAVNDIYGHHEGDNVLKFIADELKHFFRRDDVVVRLGGDEFIIFVHPCSSVTAIETKIANISQRYLQKIKEEYPESCSSLSFGGIFYNRTAPFVELYKKADRILYEVKQQCKGRTRIINMVTEK